MKEKASDFRGLATVLLYAACGYQMCYQCVLLDLSLVPVYGRACLTFSSIKVAQMWLSIHSAPMKLQHTLQNIHIHYMSEKKCANL